MWKSATSKRWQRNTQAPLTICARSAGSARVSRVGFGVAPKRSFEKFVNSPEFPFQKKSAIARRARQHARRKRYPESHLNANAVTS
jgi:hypothetical protein